MSAAHTKGPVAWMEHYDYGNGETETYFHKADSQVAEDIALYQAEQHGKTLFPLYTRADASADLLEALEEARRIIAEIDDYMKRPDRGDWGVECACCMGELLDDDREAIARIDASLTKATGVSPSPERGR